MKADSLTVRSVIHHILAIPLSEPESIEAALTASEDLHVKEAVIKEFRTNQGVRELWPEYAAFFDQRKG